MYALEFRAASRNHIWDTLRDLWKRKLRLSACVKVSRI